MGLYFALILTAQNRTATQWMVKKSTIYILFALSVHLLQFLSSQACFIQITSPSQSYVTVPYWNQQLWFYVKPKRERAWHMKMFMQHICAMICLFCGALWIFSNVNCLLMLKECVLFVTTNLIILTIRLHKSWV